MKPAPFAYCTADTTTEAIEVLTEYGDESKVLAGGQSLLALLNFRLARPAILVDIHRVQSLLEIKERDEMVSVGSCVPQRRLETWHGLGAFPALADALPFIGHVSTRNRGTIGGSIAHADPAAELPTVAVALDAQMTVMGAAGERTVSAGDFFVDHFTTVLTSAELLVSVEFSRPAAGSGQAWTELSFRYGDFALVGCAAVVHLAERRLRLVYAGIGPRPWRPRSIQVDWERPLANQIVTIAEGVAAQCEPLSDQHASAEYRRRLVKALTVRSMDRALERMKG